MKIKQGASMQGMQLEMRKAIIFAAQCLRGYGVEFVITCGTDGEHSPGSMHYYGYAFDFRSRTLSDEQKKEVCTRMSAFLGPMYQVLNEPTHIHVEMQPWAASMDKNERKRHAHYRQTTYN